MNEKDKSHVAPPPVSKEPPPPASKEPPQVTKEAPAGGSKGASGPAVALPPEAYMTEQEKAALKDKPETKSPIADKKETK